MIKFATQTLTARRFRTFCFSGTNLARKIHPRRTLEGDPARQIPCHKTLRKNPARGIHPRKTFSSALAHQIHSQKTLATNPVCIFSQKFPLERICHAKFLLPKCCERILCASSPIFFVCRNSARKILFHKNAGKKPCEPNSFPQNAMNKFVAPDLPPKNAGNPQNKKLLQKSIARRWDGHKKGATRAECDPRFAPVK